MDFAEIIVEFGQQLRLATERRLEVVAGEQDDVGLFIQRLLQDRLSYGPYALGLDVGQDDDSDGGVDLRAGNPVVRNIEPMRLDQEGVGGDQR